VNKNPGEILSHFLNLINSQTFFKEFSFSKNCFITKDNTKFEFSDYILLLNGHLIIFQFKQRNDKTESVKTELKWLENKVLKKAKNQIKRSLGYLLSLDEILVENERGHIFNIKVPDVKEIYKVIIYLYPNNKPSIFEPIKFYISKTAGFIHIFDFYSYKLICDVLYTPIEIINYLKFRESYLTLVFEAKKESEKYLLGRYLLSPKALDIEIDTRGDDYSKLVDCFD
jgi:uncharacterized protein (UPF0297 family)